MQTAGKQRRATLSMLAVAIILAFASALGLNFLVYDGKFDSAGWTNFLGVAVALACTLVSYRIAQTSSERAETGSLHAEEQLARVRIRSALESEVERKSIDFPDFASRLSLDVRKTDSLEPAEVTGNIFLTRLEQDPNTTVVTGPPGSGKSTLLQFLAIRMASRGIHGSTDYFPLLLQCKTWNASYSFTEWVSTESRSFYDISPRLTSRWLRAGTALLLLDGLDEIRESIQSSFLEELRDWSRSPVGGRVVLTCRASTYLKVASRIDHFQVASLQPLSAEQVREYLSSSVSSLRTETREKFLDLISSQASPELRSPLAVSYLRRYIESIAGEPKADSSQFFDQRTWQVLYDYLTEVNLKVSPASPADSVRASVLLVEAGDDARAHEVLQEAIASKVEHSLEAGVVPLDEQLSLDEKEVLNALPENRLLTSTQIGSKAELPPSRCNAALRRLRDRGLVQCVDDSKAAQTYFRRSSSESS